MRHVKERFKRSNSARLVGHTLRKSLIFDYGAMGAPFDPHASIPAGAWLLFSGDPESGATQPNQGERPTSLIVLDGTWPQARRMYKRLKVLAALPRLSLPPPIIAPNRLRTPTTPEGMATSEAIARALEFLGEPAAGAALDRIFALMVQRLSRTGLV